MHHPTDRITHTTAFVTPVVGHWQERQNDNDITRPQRFITHRLFGYQLYGGWTTGSFRRITAKKHSYAAKDLLMALFRSVKKYIPRF